MIKSTVKETTKDEYPFLGIALNGKIVLFTAYKTGMIVGGAGHNIGHYSVTWAMECFNRMPSGSSVTLTED